MFKLEKSKAKTFDFEYDGKEYSVPSVSSLPMKRFRAIREKLAESNNSAEVFFDEIMNLFDEYIPEVMDTIDLDEAKALFKAYSAENDEASLGES